MFIDFLTTVMINLVAGTVLLAYYLWKGIDEKISVRTRPRSSSSV